MPQNSQDQKRAQTDPLADEVGKALDDRLAAAPTDRLKNQLRKILTHAGGVARGKDKT